MIEKSIPKTLPNEVLFSLDIGTRNVVGIVGKMENGKFLILDKELMEHPDRAMYDGQIHDIDKVTEVVNLVKEKLERRLGFPLKEVAIAAAGRALKTYRAEVAMEIDYSKEIDNNIINSLDMSGIQIAQEILEKDNPVGEHKYYCVGYTVVNYYLNGGVLTSLKGHRGNNIGAEVLATFLPHVVVDSLYLVMNKVGLEVINLTLEPIAAIHVAIPPKLRLFNLALIDIGAGTSDIAITRDGSIVAYAMASVAGDEITEALAKEFLLDFEVAEKLKVQLNKKDVHTFNDIVGIPYTMSSDDIIGRISSTIEMLATEIAEKIIGNNGKSTSAVFCIGGGSQIPTLTKHLSEKLGIIHERVVIRGTEIIENVNYLCERLEGPEYITPIGIGIVSLKDQEQDFIEVFINNNQVRLLNAKRLMISDALIRMGFNARKLIARNGGNLRIKINGKERIISGEIGEPAKIILNGRTASLDTPIKNYDKIMVESALDGANARKTLKDLIYDMGTISFNGLDIKLVNNITVNGKMVTSHEAILVNGDEILFKEIVTIDDLLESFNIDDQAVEVFINGQPVSRGDHPIKNMDKVTTLNKRISKDRTNPSPVEATKEIKLKNHLEVQVNGEVIAMEIGEKPPIFVDAFKYINFDITRPRGTLNLQLNGNRANYTDILVNGDVIIIEWFN